MGTEFERQPLDTDFPETAPAAQAVFFRTYSRHGTSGRETWHQVCDRTIGGLKKLGQLKEEETALLVKMMRQLKSLPSGRWLWVGGVEWLEQQENFSGAYNCTSTNVVDWRAFGLMMDLAMMGCGTGAVIAIDYINQLPPIRNRLQVKLERELGYTPAGQRRELTEVKIEGNQVYLYVGDSRQGWVKSYQTLLELAADEKFAGIVEVIVNLADIRPEGEVLKGFGGVANPVKLPGLYQRCANILNKAVGRQLNSVECCLLIDEAAVTIVSGNIRRCLPEDALVHTAQGLVPIKDVQIGDLVQTPMGFRPVVNKFYQGYQDVYELETNSTTPRATLNHRQGVLSSSGSSGKVSWKLVGNLEPGDRLIHNSQILPGTRTVLPQSPLLTIPELTPEVAWLIGFTYGCGDVVARENKEFNEYVNVTWSGHWHNQDYANLCKKIDRVLAKFGVTADQEVSGENIHRTVCSSIGLVEYFHKFIQFSSVPLSVPNFILRGTADIRAAYLGGLIDSKVSVDNHLLITTVYPSFARQVGVVLSSLGIAGQITIERLKYNLTVPGDFRRYNDILVLYSVKTSNAKVAVNAGVDGDPEMASLYVHVPLQEEAHRGTEAQSSTHSSSFDLNIGQIAIANNPPRLQEVEERCDPARIRFRLLSAPRQTVTFKGLGSYDHVRTYDIEVEESHCFYCDGYLTHNSAGMRQGGSEDQLFATAKENLWQQDEKGNWRIDPERDSLRMANHSRVFHHKPTLTECIEAVRKQYYSGEGAIQWAGEAIARANCDLITTPVQRTAFLKAYAAGEGKQWFQSQYRSMPPAELDHRLARFGLNPCGEIIGSNFHCVSGDTLLITRDGMHHIRSLVGESVEIWNGKRWSPVVPILTGKNRKLYRVSFSDGTFLDVTEKHRFFVRNRFGKAYMEMTAGELRHRLADCKYALHTEPFKIDYLDGKFVDSIWAYTLGQLVGDGAICQSNGKPQLQLRLYGAKSYQELAIAGRTSGQLRYYAENPETPCWLDTGFQEQFDANYVRNLKKDAQLLEDFAGWSREGILHFVAGLIDADGAATKSGGVRLYISGYDRAYRIYLLLLKCGIRSSINLFARRGTATNLEICQKDLWYIQITDCAAIPCQRVDTSGGHEPKFKGKWQIIRSVEPLKREQDTFCFNEVEFHKGVFGGTLTGQCNLSEIHLNQIDPKNYREQEEAFTAGALAVASLLNHKFVEERYRYSREIDPIVGVSFTGLFDFFVHAFGVDWLRWWEQGRPDTVAGRDFQHTEQVYLNRWREIVEAVVWDYCDRHGLKRPNRCTTVQPAGTKSLLTGASPGWHPPKAQRFIRRITFRKNDPVALACLDYGYKVVPSQSDKDEKGNLLNDPFAPRCTEWLVEIPTEVSWVNIPGADTIHISKFSALAQMDFYMNVQRYYTRHNSSATIELREHEIEALGTRIYEAIRDDEGYISAALLARFDDHQTFPRLPFEPIDKETYIHMVEEVKLRRQTEDFHRALSRYDSGDWQEAGPAGCDSDLCLLPEQKP